MKIAILCPGPSLANYAGTDADLIMGINRVALSFKCDVWAANDYPVIRKMYEKVIGVPAILSRRQTLLDIKHRLDKFEKLISVDDIPERPQVKWWWQKTMTCAMAFACSQGAKLVEIHGCDWAGTKDWDGTEFGEDRTDKRWHDERERYGLMVEWMRGKGCEVVKRELIAA